MSDAGEVGVVDPGLFASPDDLAAKTGGAIAADHPDAVRELRAATARIRAYAGWHIAPVRESHVRLTSDRGSALVLLPTLRLVEVVSMHSDGNLLDLADYYLTEHGSIQGRGLSSRLGGVEVVFRHGFEAVPDELASLALQMATRSLVSPLGVVREQTLTTSVTWSSSGNGTAGGNVLLAAERSDVDPYRIPRL